MTTRRILAIGDIHFKGSNVAQTCAFERELIDVWIPQCDAVVVLGDIIDRFSQDSLNRACKFLASIHKALGGRPLWIIIGNHDRPHHSVFLTDEHPFGALKLWPNTVVADDKAVIVSLTPPLVSFLLVPYVAPGRFAEAVATAAATASAAWTNVTAVFAHQEFQGAIYGHKPSTIGDVYASNAPLCVSGHIHEFSSPQPNIVYVGAPLITHHIAFVVVAAATTTVERQPLQTIPRDVSIILESVANFEEAISSSSSFDQFRNLVIPPSPLPRHHIANLILRVKCNPFNLQHLSTLTTSSREWENIINDAKTNHKTTINVFPLTAASAVTAETAAVVAPGGVGRKKQPFIEHLAAALTDEQIASFLREIFPKDASRLGGGGCGAAATAIVASHHRPPPAKKKLRGGGTTTSR